MDEKWMPVVGYEGCYEVSDSGRVRSVARTTVRSNGRPHTLTQQIRAQKETGKGYRSVTLIRDAKLRTFTVHRLVLEAFVGPRPEGNECRHLDGNPSNNNLGNLAWGTPSENQRDSLAHGTHAQASKAKCDRGHVLEGPNLIPSKLGRRICRACMREHHNSRRDGRPFDPDKADMRYQDVLAGRVGHKSRPC
ncbi:MAG: hypothetical protein E6R04_05275 [Spirochaetes bacterium]|nr:MAG: hypothetical protein E6R04_05275 [Spirochaetota bacterium]